MAREASGLGMQPLQVPGGALSGQVEAVAPPVIQREGETWSIAIPIGSQMPISCIAFDKPIDGAATLMKFIGLAKQGAKGITVRGIVPTDAGAIEESAYMTVKLEYTQPTDKGLLGGQVKMMVRPDADASLFCYQDEVGYAATFKRVTTGLARSLRSAHPTPRPNYVEILVTHLGDTPIGFERRTVSSGAQGGKIDEVVECQFLPRTAEDLLATDTVHIEQSDSSGRLVLVDSVAAHGEEVESQFHLSRRGKRDYTFEGKQSGKPVSGTFKSKEKEGLASALLVANRLRALLGGKGAELGVEEYHPTLAPKPLDVVYRKAGDGSGITLLLGKLQAKLRLDERGMLTDFSIPLAGTTMREERILARGTP